MRIAEKTGALSISFAGAESRTDSNGESSRTKNGKLTVFAGGLQDGGDNAIEKKRQEIRQKATKVLRDKFAIDQKRDEGLEESREKTESAKTDMKEANDRISELEEWLENAPEEALQDEEMMKTYRNALGQAKVERIQAQNTIVEETADIISTKLSKLKEGYEQSMGYASDVEEEILQTGADEIIGMMQQEAMDHIDEQYQENIEKAQEQKEKKEEQEEKLEAVRESREEIRQEGDAVWANAMEEQEQAAKSVDTILTDRTQLDDTLQQLQKEAEQMDEALKGLLVDASL